MQVFPVHDFVYIAQQYPKVGMCRELAVLDLRGNALAELPPELARCTVLAFLHVGGNKIVEFQSALCEAFVNLQELYLYRNKLTFLPPEVSRVWPNRLKTKHLVVVGRRESSVYKPRFYLSEFVSSIAEPL